MHRATSDQKMAYWGYGEWVEEADDLEWKYKGIKCRIHRQMKILEDAISGLGHLCGYIIIPLNHPWSKIEKDHDFPCEVHGGITFSSLNEEGIEIGFDCAHSEDETPFTMEKMLKFTMNYIKSQDSDYLNNSTYLDSRNQLERLENINLNKSLISFYRKKNYKNMSFVKGQCESLVNQMINVKSEQRDLLK